MMFYCNFTIYKTAQKVSQYQMIKNRIKSY